MGKEDVGLDFGNDLVQPRFRRCHLGVFAQHRQAGTADRRRTVGPSIDEFLRLIRLGMKWSGQMMRFPAQAALFGQQRQAAERIAALQRDGMVEDVQDTHTEIPRREGHNSIRLLGFFSKHLN